MKLLDLAGPSAEPRGILWSQGAMKSAPHWPPLPDPAHPTRFFAIFLSSHLGCDGLIWLKKVISYGLARHVKWAYQMSKIYPLLLLSRIPSDNLQG